MTVDIFTDAGRMVTVTVPTFEIGYAVREDVQNVSVLVQFYAAYPTHNVWGSMDLLTCGRIDEDGNLTQTYDIFDIGLRGTGSLDHAVANSSEFQFMSSLLRGVEIEMKKINDSDYVCMNDEYYCYPVTFDENGLYENVTIDDDGNVVVKQGDVIDAITFTTTSDSSKIDSILNLTFGPKLLSSDNDLGFELEIGSIQLEVSQGAEASSPMAQFYFKGLQIGMGSIEEWLSFEFHVPDIAYGDALGQFAEDISSALSSNREDAIPVAVKIDGNLELPRRWASITALSKNVPTACVNETMTICTAEANAVVFTYSVNPQSVDVPLPGDTLENLVNCLHDDFATLSETCHLAVHAGRMAFENVETDDILRAVRGGWNSTFPNVSSCTNFSSIFDQPSNTSEAALAKEEAERVLRSLDIVGGDSIGSDIVIPCVLEMVCPDDTSQIDLSDKSFIGRALISVNNAAKKLSVNNLTVLTPEIAFQTRFSSLGLGSLDTYTEFATFRIGEINFAASAKQESTGDDSLTDIFAYLVLDDVMLLHNIINRFMGAYDSRIQVRGAAVDSGIDGATLFSQVLNRFAFTMDIETTKDQFDEFGNPVAVGETVTPPSFWYPTQCEGSWDVYVVVGTRTDHLPSSSSSSFFLLHLDKLTHHNTCTLSLFILSTGTNRDQTFFPRLFKFQIYKILLKCSFLWISCFLNSKFLHCTIQSKSHRFFQEKEVILLS